MCKGLMAHLRTMPSQACVRYCKPI